MFDTVDDAAPGTEQHWKIRQDETAASAGEAVKGDGGAIGESPSSTEHEGVQSALAYDLLLPDSATSIASIRVAGDPVLAELPRDGVTMVSCRLTGDETLSRGIDRSEQSAEMTSDGRSLPFAPSSLDCVILHGTLDRWRDARSLLGAARTALGEGGIVALTAANRLDPAHLRRCLGLKGGVEGHPVVTRRSLWGYHRLLRGCGLSPAASYFVLEDPTGTPKKIISTCYAPSTAFFRLELSAATGSKRLVMLGLNAVNLLPHAQGRFLILARK